ncbi:2'-5' RNA ligase family protein [Sediminibacillus massiliensis]|uniref:2'-5' RNA ligase family protein n=1 Tax=Sediminibacillus massiliensis TaxID=1926277 RepID=UPI0009884583|nr:2'-5' RNA ligase family protein [Sediminibacillus massiliensis]
MYWVVGLFDEKTEHTVKKIWDELSVITHSSQEIKDGRPHITLGSYNDLETEEYIMLMDRYYDTKPPIKITFNTLGTFLNYRTLFLTPTVTTELLAFHADHHEYFNKFNKSANPYYLPDSWIPHCTLANKLSTGKLTEAFQHCIHRQETINGIIKEIALIEMAGEEEDCIHAPIIFSKSLTDE